MKTDCGASDLFAVDVITAETKKFFRENLSANIADSDFDFFSGKQSGNSASLFSACAFRIAAADNPVASKDDKIAAATKLAAAAAGYLNKQPQCATFGRATAQNGYINFTFGEEYLAAVLKYYAVQFDKLYKDGRFEKYRYGNKSEIYGMSRYCINRIMSVHETLYPETAAGIVFSRNFTDEIQKDIAGFVVYVSGRKNIGSTDTKRCADFLSALFYEADSCIKNATMIYLDLYKACAYVLHVLTMKEELN